VRSVWQHRPRVIVIEATRPTTSVPSHRDREHILLDSAHLYASFDGLTRYYVAEEHRDDIERLQVPANESTISFPMSMHTRSKS
jgi:hypothetical protein